MHKYALWGDVMEITDLIRRGKSELYKTFVDGEYVCLLEEETLYKHKIKIGTKLSEHEFEQLRKESENLTCKNVAINYVSKSLKTRQQTFDNLKQKGFLISSINNALDMLENYGYINDKYYAEMFIKSKQNSKGILYIKSALKQKGIKENIINEVLCEYKSNEQDIEMLAEKYLKNKQKNIDTKQKLYRHLLSKGFTYEEVQKIISKLFSGDIE